MTESSLQQLAAQALGQGYPQALQVRVWSRDHVTFQKKFGIGYKYFDVGSLTKILVTTPLLMKLWQDNRLDLEKPVGFYLGFLWTHPVGRIPVKDLLRHSSGLTWWKPFYERLQKISWQERPYALKNHFRSERVGPRGKCVYSDLDFIILGWLAEELTGLPLDEAAQLYLLGPMGLKNTFFLRHGEKNSLKVARFAPTEKHKFRGRLQKTVFDDNAWAVGGVSGHAGLYSTLEEVSCMGQELLTVHQGERGHGIWKTSTVRHFTKRAISKARGDWALGFVIPSRPLSTAGAQVSTEAFGHTGYTGTSLWVDVPRKTVVTILSNRTFPTRQDERFLKLRRDLHDAVWEKIDGRG